MSRSTIRSNFYDFGPFRLDVENRLLLHGGDVVPLQPKTFDILLLLVENRGRVVEKDELMRRVWPDTAVEESNLTQNIYVLRKIFSAGADGQKYIETMAKRGYRFVAPVSEGNGAHAAVTAQPTSSEPVAPDAALDASAGGQASHSRPRAALRWGLPAFLILLSLGIAAYLAKRHGPPQEPIRSIAVLPLAPLNADADQEYLGLGIADDLITRLSSTRQIVVRPMSTVVRQASHESDPVALGRALAVDAVLTGSVRRAQDLIRVNVRLIRVADGASLWEDILDVKLADILAMQDQVSEQLARTLTLELSGEARRLLTRHYTESAEAYQLYLKGAYYLKKRTREAFNTSIDYLRQALKKDPQYALAYRGLAAAYSLQSLFGFVPSKEAMPQAEGMARHALEIEATLAGAHVALGTVRMYYDWNLAEAAGEIQRAIELDPNLPEAHQLYALCLAALGRFDDARKQLQAARQLDPGSQVIESSAIWVAYLAGQYDEAISLGRQAIESDPGFYLFYQHLGCAYLAKQMYEPAIAALRRARLLSANAPGTLARLAYAEAVAGNRQEARQALAELQKAAAPAQVIPYVYLGLSEDARALEWLQRAYEERAGDLIYLATDPIYDRLRATPQFKALLKRVGFAP
ncbi:MAG TPA: winged helix-turn-helix domain-containing protein [Blastocatellia bacterium]|nr:winged helix-turn-helix domain-containing protein [Blastocatellia bacterium]